MKNIPVVHSFLTTMCGLITFVRSSPKRLVIFNSTFEGELNNEDETDVDDAASAVPNSSLPIGSFKKAIFDLFAQPDG